MERARIGPYETLQEIGRGGMGVVYRARHAATGAQVALKVARTSSGMLSSIRTEIRALLRVQHPSVVRILDHGVDGGAPWYAMEFLEGRSWLDLNRELWPRARAPTQSTLDLCDVTASTPSIDYSDDRHVADPAPEAGTGRSLAANGRLGEILRLAMRVCTPLAVLHGRGLVHRDLKPANVFLRADGQPVLVDLGLAARFARQGRERLEVAGLVAGTAQYMAPEQVRGRHVDARADLYSLGAMLYESITGRVPFTGQTIQALLGAVANDPPVPPSVLVDGVSAELDGLVLALLAKDPRDRIGYADDVAVALARIAGEPFGRGEEPRAYLYRPGVAGRDEVMAPVLARADRARTGSGSLVLIGGESGVGKTVLAAEVGRVASRRHLTVVTGECTATLASEQTLLESAGAPLHPLRPLLQLVADSCRAEGAAACDRVLGPHAGVLAPYEPAFSALPSLRRWPEPFALPGELARRRVLEALTQTLESYVDAFGPVLVILDDVQWADDLTLGFLGSLTPEWLAARGVMFLGTYRKDEVGDGLRALLAGPAVERVDLDRLPPGSIAEMVSDMLAVHVPPPPFVDFLYARSEGNPFFVAEYLRVAVQEGLLTRTGGQWRLPAGEQDFDRLPQPRSLVALVEQRLSGLSARARAVLEIAAVLGRETHSDLLVAVAGGSDDEAHEGLRELLDRQVLEAGPDGTVRFLHDKLRERAYAGIDPTRAIELHRRAGEALERRAGEGSATWALLAHHWREAQVWTKAVDYLERAVEQDLAQFSNAEAKKRVDALRALGARLPGGPGPLRTGRWARFLADAALGQGEFDAGRAHAEAALAAFETPFPATPAAIARSLLAQVAWMVLRRVLPRAGVPDDPDARRIRQESLGVFAVLMDFFIYENEPLRGIYSGVRVVAMGEPMGPSRPVARALGLIGPILMATPLKAIGRRWRQRALEMAERLGDPMTQVYCDVRIAASYVFVAEWAACDRLLDRGLAVAALARDDKRQEEANISRAFQRYMQGRFAEALQYSEAVEVSAQRRGDLQSVSFARSGRAQALIRLGRLQEAEAALAPALSRVEREGTLAEKVLVWGILALLRLELGDHRQAREVAGRALEQLRAGPIVLWFFAPATYAVAEVWLRLAVGDPDADMRALAAARARDAVKIVRTFAKTFPVADAMRGLLDARTARLDGKGRAAELLAAASAERAARDGLPYEEAQARLLLAELGAPDRLVHLRRARELLVGCGATREAGLVPLEAA